MDVQMFYTMFPVTSFFCCAALVGIVMGRAYLATTVYSCRGTCGICGACPGQGDGICVTVK